MRRNRLLEILLQTGARLVDSHLISKVSEKGPGGGRSGCQGEETDLG